MYYLAISHDGSVAYEGRPNVMVIFSRSLGRGWKVESRFGSWEAMPR